MDRLSLVQADKIAAVHRQNCSCKFYCTHQHVFVWNFLIGTLIFMCCEHIMSPRTKRINKGMRNVFVRVETNCGRE